MPTLPRTFSLDPDALMRARTQPPRAALDELLAQANQALPFAPVAVTQKSFAPPSGDPHDYVSLARYFWRNPETPDGLPYISRDGQVNPEIFSIPDHRNFDLLMENVFTLSLAHWFTHDARYASHAAKLLRVWFLDSDTRMNPHLNFAQAIRGVNDGRGIGIIESRELALVVDAVGLLADSSAWSAHDEQAMREWCAQFLDWLRASQHGRDESNQKNNHGTFYDSQVAALALFVGAEENARATIERALQLRLATQFLPDGQQPLELARTLSWHYSVFNLQAWLRLASLGERVGLDVWNFQTRDGIGIRCGVDYLARLVGNEEWTHPQIAPREFAGFFGLLWHAADKWHDERYHEIARALPGMNAETHRVRLYVV